MPEYIILRNRRRSQSGRSALGAAPSALDSDAEPQLERDELRSRSLALLAEDPSVKAVAPVMPIRLIAPIKEALATPDAWGLKAVGALGSRWSGKGVRVAVLDTGIDAGHPAFASMKLSEKDFTGEGNGDKQGHGTHCAGTIFGRDVAGTRIGVAPGIREALIGKVLANDGLGTSDAVFDGLIWAMQMRADVISMSLGFDFAGMVERLAGEGWPVDLATSNALEAYRGNLRMFDAVMQLLKAKAAFGISPLVVAAAGNESRRQIDSKYRIAASLPAAAADVISVAAVHRHGERFEVAAFSNSMPVISAPGTEIVSAAARDGLASLSGTSMACPHVAGASALWCERVRSEGMMGSSRDLTARLLSTAHRGAFEVGVTEQDVGAGLVQCPE
jgi:subtilisin family serine protease